MSKEYKLIKIVLLRLARGGVGTVPMVGQILEHALIGTWEDFKDERYKKDVQQAIENLQAQLSELQNSNSAVHRHGPAQMQTLDLLTSLLNNLQSPYFKEHPHVSRQQTDRLEEVVTNFIECVNNPSQALPTRELEAAIEKRALSRGRLERIDRLANRIVIEVNDLETGKWFFPLHFLRHEVAIPEMMSDPFRALVKPPDHHGYPKQICINAKPREFSLTAYPKPVVLDSLKSGVPQQLDEVLLDRQLSSAPFEYWPNGRRAPKFIVESKLSDALQLVFREKGGANSPILCLRMRYSN